MSIDGAEHFATYQGAFHEQKQGEEPPWQHASPVSIVDAFYTDDFYLAQAKVANRPANIFADLTYCWRWYYITREDGQLSSVVELQDENGPMSVEYDDGGTREFKLQGEKLTIPHKNPELGCAFNLQWGDTPLGDCESLDEREALTQRITQYVRGDGKIKSG